MLPALGLALATRDGGATRDPGAWMWLCLAVSGLGLLGRAVTKGVVPHQTSGRLGHHEAGSLNTTGAYSVVRHPLYVSNFLVVLGVVLLPGVWWLPVVYAGFFALVYGPILHSEEVFLRRTFGEDHRRWAARTPALCPRPDRWRPSPLAFSVRTVIRREASTWLAVAVAFPAVALLIHVTGTGHWDLSGFWIGFLGVGVAGWVTVRALKHRTRWLHVEGR
jgi:protein-S-isoprenylcysteine O-methyltransferase Ste14